MEYNWRHMIAVGSCDAKNLLRARNEAEAVFGTCVSSVFESNSNRYQAFSVECSRAMPRGRNDCIGARRKYQRWLRCAETGGPAAQVDWIEVKYDNKCASPAIMASSDPSNITCDAVAVLAAILGLSVSQLLYDLCAIHAVCSTDSFDVKKSSVPDKLPSTTPDIQQFSSKRGFVSPVSSNHLAIELPPGHLRANPDADLIRLCGFMLDTKGQIAELYGRPKTTEDERWTGSELILLSEQRRWIEDTLYDTAAPRTLEGAQAMARLALATWPIALEEGKPTALDFREWLSLSVIEYIAELRPDHKHRTR